MTSMKRRRFRIVITPKPSLVLFRWKETREGRDVGPIYVEFSAGGRLVSRETFGMRDPETDRPLWYSREVANRFAKKFGIEVVDC